MLNSFVFEFVLSITFAIDGPNDQSERALEPDPTNNLNTCLTFSYWVVPFTSVRMLMYLNMRLSDLKD